VALIQVYGVGSVEPWALLLGVGPGAVVVEVGLLGLVQVD